MYFYIKELILSFFFEFNTKNNTFSKFDFVLIPTFFSMVFGSIILLIIYNTYVFMFFSIFYFYLNLFGKIDDKFLTKFYSTYNDENSKLTFGLLQKQMNIKSNYKSDIQFPYIQKMLFFGADDEATGGFTRIFVDLAKTTLGKTAIIGTILVGDCIGVMKKKKGDNVIHIDNQEHLDRRHTIDTFEV